jgi:polysaccharide pyruvyl transferase WcaK-like protein
MIFKVLLFAIRLLRKITPRNGRVLMIPPAPPGSLGDEALIEGFSALISESESMIDELLIYPSKESHSHSSNKKYAYINYKHDGKLSLLLLLFKTIRHRKFILVGADALDGAYSKFACKAWLEILSYVAYTGGQARAISFSFSNTPNMGVVQHINNTNDGVVFIARDPLSRARFEQFTNKSCSLAADLAISMKPIFQDKATDTTVSWIAKQKSINKVMLGLNINLNYLNDDVDVQSIMSNFVNSFDDILASHPDLCIVMLPHDFRAVSDWACAKKFIQGLSNKYSDRLIVIPDAIRAWEVKFLVSKLDFVITGRMHVAIAALSSLIPTYCFTYLDKFEGLMQHFNIKDNLMSMEKMQQTANIKAFVELAISDYQHQCKAIKIKLDEVMYLSKSNVVDKNSDNNN